MSLGIPAIAIDPNAIYEDADVLRIFKAADMRTLGRLDLPHFYIGARQDARSRRYVGRHLIARLDRLVANGGFAADVASSTRAA